MQRSLFKRLSNPDCIWNDWWRRSWKSMCDSSRTYDTCFFALDIHPFQEKMWYLRQICLNGFIGCKRPFYLAQDLEEKREFQRHVTVTNGSMTNVECLVLFDVFEDAAFIESVTQDFVLIIPFYNRHFRKKIDWFILRCLERGAFVLLTASGVVCDLCDVPWAVANKVSLHKNCLRSLEQILDSFVDVTKSNNVFYFEKGDQVVCTNALPSNFSQIGDTYSFFKHQTSCGAVEKTTIFSDKPSVLVRYKQTPFVKKEDDNYTPQTSDNLKNLEEENIGVVRFVCKLNTEEFYYLTNIQQCQPKGEE